LGVAFGLKRDRQKIGDVLVSRQVLNYELQRVSNKQRILRGDRVQSTPLLLDRLRSGAVDWKKFNIHFGLIMSGEKLADSTAFTRELLENEPEAIGGEMEGAGLYAASVKSRSRWIIVKGISDWGENKSSDFQRQAAGNAVDFVLHVIRQGALTEEV
jgi:nucleoside phosphorylase